MYDFIEFSIARMKQMPLGLRMLTLMALLFTLIAPAAFLPGGKINDIRVSYSEWWRSGGGPVFLAVGITFAFVAYGFLRATRWSRPLCLLAVASPSIVALFQFPDVSDSIFLLVIVSLIALYLFRRRTVRFYYERFSQQTAA